MSPESNNSLPAYERPPVVEIIGAVQFAPMPRFGIADVIALGRTLSDWEFVESPPAIPPMGEGPSPIVMPQAMFGIGAPMRVIMQADTGRWTAQVQQDRLAVHETKREDRPSFTNVKPRLNELAENVSSALLLELFGVAHPADMVEVIYENAIRQRDGGWDGFSDLGRVLRIINTGPGVDRFSEVEQAGVQFSYLLEEAGEMAGRLRVIGEPQYDEEGGPVLALRLVSRRFVSGRALDDVLEACHADIVEGFTAITTENMHEIWGRLR